MLCGRDNGTKKFARENKRKAINEECAVENGRDLKLTN